MHVIPSNFTVAEYCNQLNEDKIIVNFDYQRSNKVWPPAARSYLIDTILLDFPLPKISLYQRTDLKSRKTIKEIVDGQQRSNAILAFFKDEFRLTGHSQFVGKKFSQLEEPDQIKFLQYQLSVDIFAEATPDEIRQVFRRINSYNVPLNPQEKRHALFQGEFKWFIISLSEKYDNTLKGIGVLSEKQLSRMADGKLFTEIVLGMFEGITSSSETKLNKVYKDYDDSFKESDNISKQIDTAFEWIINWQAIHNTALMKSYHFHTLMLAIIHTLNPVSALKAVYSVDRLTSFNNDIVLTNLTTLNEALEQTSRYKQFSKFVEASSSSTNKKKQREARFNYFCRALQPHLIQ